MNIEASGNCYELDLIPYLDSTDEMIALPASLVGLMLWASQSDKASWMACLTISETDSEISRVNSTE